MINHAWSVSYVTCGNCQASKYGRVNDRVGVLALRIARSVTSSPVTSRDYEATLAHRRRREIRMWVNCLAGQPDETCGGNLLFVSFNAPKYI